MVGPSWFRSPGTRGSSVPAPSSAAIGRLPEAATVSTGRKWTRTSAPKACCAERPRRRATSRDRNPECVRLKISHAEYRLTSTPVPLCGTKDDGPALQSRRSVLLDHRRDDLLFWFQILPGLPHIVRGTEIAPIIFVSPKGENLFFAARQTQIAVDDREHPFFRHFCKKARRNYVDAAKSQRLQLLRRPNQFNRAIAP